MKRALMVVTAVLMSSSLLAEEASRQRYLVATRSPVIGAVRHQVAEELGQHRSFEAFESVNGFAAELTEEEVRQLRNSPHVRYVEPDPVKYALEIVSADGAMTPNAQARSRNGQTIPFGIDLVRSRQVWPVAKGRTIRVGVVDSGADMLHPDLRANIKGGRDFVQNDDDPTDENGHGTHVAGTVGALDNNLGVVGVAPDVDLFILRVLNAEGSGSTGNVIRAVDWAIANELDILSLSLGSANSSTMEEAAFQRAADAGILVFAASGNCHTSCGEFANGRPNIIDFPAGYSTVISVGAIDSQSRSAGFSQRGPRLGVVAPGVGVLSAARSGLSSISDLLLADSTVVEGESFTYSPQGEVTGEYVFAGIGRPEDFTSAVQGKIALIARGELTFGDKARNAKAAGATAVVIFNNLPASDPSGGPILGTLCRESDASGNCTLLEDTTFPYPLTIGISKEKGEELVARSLGPITASIRPDDYTELQGTSMATPHVSGVAALLWSIVPDATATQIGNAILSTAIDLGEPGVDLEFGHGRVDALEAARLLAPERFPNTPKKVRTRR